MHSLRRRTSPLRVPFICLHGGHPVSCFSSQGSSKKALCTIPEHSQDTRNCIASCPAAVHADVLTAVSLEYTAEGSTKQHRFRMRNMSQAAFERVQELRSFLTENRLVQNLLLDAETVPGQCFLCVTGRCAARGRQPQTKLQSDSAMLRAKNSTRPRLTGNAVPRAFYLREIMCVDDFLSRKSAGASTELLQELVNSPHVRLFIKPPCGKMPTKTRSYQLYSCVTPQPFISSTQSPWCQRRL